MGWSDGVALLGVLLGAGGFAALAQARSVNRRTNAEARGVDATAEVTLGEGWRELVTQQRIEINELRERLALLEERDARCQARLALLESGETPAALERRVADLVNVEINRREEVQR